MHRSTDAERLALNVYAQLIDLLKTLNDDDWRRPTECVGWDVTDMVGHLIGSARSASTIRSILGDQLYGLRHRKEFDGNGLDATNARQIREQAGLSPAERIAELTRLAPIAVAGRMRWTPILRFVNGSVDASGSTASGMPRKENGRHLYEIVVTRDTWMQTIDIARATGKHFPVSLPCNHRLVEDVVAEWSSRHGKAFELDLTGPAGGRYRQGTGGEKITLDAIEFARILSGREEASGLLNVRVLF